MSLHGAGCDTRITDEPMPHVPVPLVRSGLYATDWIVAAASYDLMRSVGAKGRVSDFLD